VAAKTVATGTNEPVPAQTITMVTQTMGGHDWRLATKGAVTLKAQLARPARSPKTPPTRLAKMTPSKARKMVWAMSVKRTPLTASFHSALRTARGPGARAGPIIRLDTSVNKAHKPKEMR
jgi:hypothetical protein